MSEDPYVSAVVHLVDTSETDRSAPVGEGGDVAAEGAAVLAGTTAAPVSQRRFAGPLEIPVPPSPHPPTRVRGYFTSAGFEVHAPMGTMFSIGAGKARFEGFFGVELVVDEERLGAPMTTGSGERDLPLQGLPDEIRRVVERITLPLPPQLAGLE